MSWKDFKRGDAVYVMRQKYEARSEWDLLADWKMPTKGTVVYRGRKFIVVEMLSDDGRFLYRESFWPGEVSAWENWEESGRTR